MAAGSTELDFDRCLDSAEVQEVEVGKTAVQTGMKIAVAANQVEDLVEEAH